ncbi:MAG TPA: type II toxin-antitoxin system HipA family toxin [Longimicrobiales bacterium]|nr:type II toxin-antitoxin system HipA family toxin [Longimicrobiales bacterium]
MADVTAAAEVRLWGRLVGGVVELADGEVVFEYDDAFRTSGPGISPLKLPATLRRPVQFPELRRKEAFQGLPGVLADALPDAFGTTVMRAYYTSRGELEKAFSPVQHLLYVGERALGALTFHPAEELPGRAAEAEALEVARLVADARRIVQGDADVTIPEIFRIGSSAGGMRPKAVVLQNPETGEVRSAFAEPRPGDVPAILKFDGVGDGRSVSGLGPPQPFNRIEAAYAAMAREAGLDVVAPTILESPEGHAHLLIPRFDRIPDGSGFRRLHQHTLGGLLHVDYNDPGASSYEEYLRTMLRLGLPPAALDEGYRRMVFNVLAVNQDDHVKNLSFHMDPAAVWSLTPAYDLTFARGFGFTRAHQMRVRDKREGITRADLIAVAEEFGIRAPGRVLERVGEAVGRWAAFAEAVGVPAEDARRVQEELETRRREIAP